MIRIRTIAEAEIPIIQRLARDIWPIAYQDILSTAQMDYMLQMMYSLDELRAQMRSGHLFLIAQENDEDLGFAGFSLVDAATGIYKLHKLYVLPSAQGKGIGKILINEVISRAKQAGGTALQLNVNRKNNALDFYVKAGFAIQTEVDLDIGNGFFMNDYVMEKALV